MQQRGIPWTYLIPTLILIIIIGGLVYYNAVITPSSKGGDLITIPANTPPSLSDVPGFCDQPSGCNYHWHVHLDIFVRNVSQVVVPADLGHIGSTNLYAIHTHDASGIIHLECCNPASENKTFTLGELFEVWGYPTFDSTHCLNYSGLPVATYVNGTLWQKGSIANIPLTQHDEIAIVIGTPGPTTIPRSYSFPSGL